MREFRDYLGYARKYLLLAEDKAERHEDVEWLLIPAIILAWSAMELFVNNRCNDLSSIPSNMFQLHESAFLQEKRLRFEDSGINIGKFVLDGKEYQALENKIFFLLSKMGAQDTTKLKGGTLWKKFKSFKDARDSLTHPRTETEIAINLTVVREYIETAQDLIQMISEQIWNKKLDF